MERVVKILASVLFSIWICSIVFWLYCVFDSPFCKHHPGIVLVVVGFIGAIVFGHEHSKTLGKRLAWWFDMILLAGLLLEMREAVNEDSKILSLERQLQPRMIPQKQINDFIFLTKDWPKFPVRVAVALGEVEAGDYAWQIRDMLKEAHFPVPDSDTNFSLGIDFVQGIITLPYYSNTNGWASVNFLYRGTNNPDHFTGFNVSKTNGFTRYYVLSNDTNSMEGGLINAFSQIGIAVGAQRDSNSWMDPNQFMIYVNPKNQ